MRVPEPSGCCCCFDLRTGTLLIGILSIIGSLMDLAGWVSGFRMAQLSPVMRQMYAAEEGGECDDDCETFIRNVLLGFTIWQMVVDIVHVIIASILVHGVRKAKTGLFMPFIIWELIQIGLSVVFIIGVVCLFAKNTIFIISFIVTIIILYPISLYFLAVVNAYRLKMCRDQGTEPMIMESNDYQFPDKNDTASAPPFVQVVTNDAPPPYTAKA